MEVWRFSQMEGTEVGDLTIITGMGRGSLHAFQPVVSFRIYHMMIKPVGLCSWSVSPSRPQIFSNICLRYALHVVWGRLGGAVSKT